MRVHYIKVLAEQVHTMPIMLISARLISEFHSIPEFKIGVCGDIPDLRTRSVVPQPASLPKLKRGVHVVSDAE